MEKVSEEDEGPVSVTPNYDRTRRGGSVSGHFPSQGLRGGVISVKEARTTRDPDSGLWLRISQGLFPFCFKE